MDAEMSHILDQIRTVSQAERMIVYGVKRDGDKVRDMKIMLVCVCSDKQQLAARLYMGIDGDIAFGLLIYTPDEFDELVSDPQSYASRIVQIGSEYL